MLKYEQLSDLQLFERLKKDDHYAFQVLYHRYVGKIYYFIVDISQGDYYLAEEIVQMTFVKLWECRHELVIRFSLFNYLYTISRNLFLNHISKKIHEEMLFDALKEVSEKNEDAIFEEVDLKFLMTDVERIISKLPAMHQRVYRMKHIEQLSQKEIAQKLSITENTVESYLKYSNKYLKTMLGFYRKEILNGFACLIGLFISL